MQSPGIPGGPGCGVCNRETVWQRIIVLNEHFEIFFLLSTNLCCLDNSDRLAKHIGEWRRKTACTSTCCSWIYHKWIQDDLLYSPASLIRGTDLFLSSFLCSIILVKVCAISPTNAVIFNMLVNLMLFYIWHGIINNHYKRTWTLEI